MTNPTTSSSYSPRIPHATSPSASSPADTLRPCRLRCLARRRLSISRMSATLLTRFSSLVADYKDDEFCRGFVIGEVAADFDRPPELCVQSLNGVRRVDDPAHRLREGEEGNDSVPVAPPGLRDGGIFSPPGAGIESVERRLAGVGVLGPVDHAQRRHDRLAIFPQDELQRMPDQMHDAGLDDRLRKDGVDRFGESLQAIDNGDENVADAPVPEFVHDSQPELGAFGVLDPQAENILRAVCLDAQGDVDRLVADHALVSDLDPHCVEEDERVTRLQRTVLPFRHGLKNRVRHRRDQIGGDLEPIELHEVALNLPRGHAARIHRHDLLVEAGEAALIAGDQLRIERPFPIAWNPDVELRGLQNGLLRMPVAMVPPPRGGLAFEMVVEFGVENTLGKRLLQLVEKPVLVENLFRVTAVQKLVQGVFLDRHKRPPSASLWPRTQDS